MGLATLLVKALAVLVSCCLTKFVLHDVTYRSHRSVVVEELAVAVNSTDAIEWDVLGMCEPRWSSDCGRTGGLCRTRVDQAATLASEQAQCFTTPQSVGSSSNALGCSGCSSLSCDVCAAAQDKHACYGEGLSYQQRRQHSINIGNQAVRTSDSHASAVDVDIGSTVSSQSQFIIVSDAGLAAGLAVDQQPIAEFSVFATIGTQDPSIYTADSLEVGRTCAAGTGGVNPIAAAVAGDHSEAAAAVPPLDTQTLNWQDAAPQVAAVPAVQHDLIDISQQLDLGGISIDSAAGPAAETTRPPAAEETLLQMLSAAIQPTIAAAAAEEGVATVGQAPGSTVAAGAGTSAADTMSSLQVNRLAAPGSAAAQAEWAPDIHIMPFMTPASIMKAFRAGISDSSFPMLPTFLGSIFVTYIMVVHISRLVSKGQKVSLPQSVSKDPKQLEVQFTLHKLAHQQAMWFRLLGVSGAAVLRVHRAQQHCKQAVAQANGIAQYARDLLRRQQKRLQRLHAEQVAALEQQLQRHEEQYKALQQQYVDAQQQHAEELQQEQAVAEQQQAVADQQHKQELLQQQQQLEQHWRQELQKLQTKHAALQAHEKELAADVRSKADVIAEQRACVASLSQQLIEVKSEKAGLSSELQRVREQLVVEKSRVEFILHEEQEVKGKAADVNQKYQTLQDQLSEVRSSNAQLTNEVQHLQAAHAAAEGTIQELQQQLASTNSQLADSRGVGAEYASKVAQLEERSKGLQEQLSSVQAARDDLAGQLRELQGLYTAADATNKDLEQKLSASTAAVADGRANIVQLQEQLKQLEDRMSEQRDRYSELQGRHQQLQTSLIAAEASINELRGEKQAIERKAEQLQQQLSSTLADLGQLRSDHATATAQLQQSKEASQQLQEQLAASQAQFKEQSGQLAAVQQVLSSTQEQLQSTQHQQSQAEGRTQQLAADKQQLETSVQQLESTAAEQQAALTAKQQQVAELSSSLQQEQAAVAGLHLQLDTISTAKAQLEVERESLDQNLYESMQLLEDREALLQLVQEEKAALDIELTAVRANLATRTATLREAQASLSETEGKLHEEYEKSWELGRENMNLQQQLDRLKEDNRQIGQELDDVTSDRDDLADKLEKLAGSYEVLLEESKGIQGHTEGLLAENLDSLVQLEGKFTAAQAGLAAVTKERDDLAKKLFWAEIARDQHGAAKNLANQEAIAARKDLMEEKLIKTRSPVPGASACASGGGGGGLSGGGASGGSHVEDRPALSRANSRGRAWPEVKTGYLHQQFSERPPTGRPSSSHGHSSPRSPIHSPTPSSDAAMFTPHSGLYANVLRAGLSPSNSRCSSAPCTPRSGEDGADSASIASGSSPAGKQMQEQQQQGSAASGSSAAVSAGSRLRRSASMPSVPDLLLLDADDAHQDPAATAAQGSDAGVAAAVEGLRRNFSDISAPVTVGGEAAAAEEVADSAQQQQSSGGSPSGQQYALSSRPSRDDGEQQDQEQVQQQRQQQVESSPEKLSPPLLESTYSPNMANSGKSSSKNVRSQGSRPDRSLLPLNLSPVPFDLTASSDMGASRTSASLCRVSAAAASPAAAAADGSMRDADALAAQHQGIAASPAPSIQVQVEEFFTPLPLASRQGHDATGDGTTLVAAAADAVAATPYFTPVQAQRPSTAAIDHQAGSPDASPATGGHIGRSFRSTSELDDEADVLIGSMTESDFASAVSRASSEAAHPAAAVRDSQGAAAGMSSDVQRQLASEAVAAVTRRQQSRLAQGSSGSILQSVQQQEAGPPAAQDDQQQQQQQKKLSKNQKKKLRQKQKRQAAAQQSLQYSSIDPSVDSVLTGLIPQQSEEQLVDASHEGSVLADDAHAEVHLSIVYDSREDAPVGRGRADSPPKMFIRGPAAAGVQSSGSSAGTGGRYGSPVKGRGVPPTPFATGHTTTGLDAAAAAAGRSSAASSVDDVASESAVAAANTGEGLLASAGSGGSYTGPASSGSRLGPGKSGLGSPSRTSCSSIKNLVAQSRLRDAELGSSSGSSRLGGNSPQRFRAKFGVTAGAASPTAAGALSSSVECVSPLKNSISLPGHPAALSTVNQDLCFAGQTGSGPHRVLNTPVRPGGLGSLDAPGDDVVQGSVELGPYRTSVHWKALSDSVTLSACELSMVRLGSRGGGVASPAGGKLLASAADDGDADVLADVQLVDRADGEEDVPLLGAASVSQEWKVAENILYFE